MEIIVAPEALEHLREFKKIGNKATLKKIERIFSELSINPYSGVGNPEPLKYEWSGYWSRQIDKKNRLIYRVDEEKIFVFVVSAKGHYKDR
jgi:toxin YoeB